MSDVFVSYKAEDRKRVKPLVEALEAEGYSVWWDEQIGGGTAWRHAIEAELNAAKCVVVAWSKRSVGPDGTFVQDEATRAQQRRVYVPVTIDKVHLPLGFGETQALPLTGWHGDRSDPRYQAVTEAIRRVAGDATTDRGPVSLGSTPVNRRTAVAGGAVAVAAVAGGGAWMFLKPSSAAASDSIAVLPFANMSGDPSQAYFADGIAEELRTALTRLAGLRVVGRTSSEAVRNEDAETAAKKLRVTNILTGSVRQSPSTIRISAELIDGQTGLERWSQDYDRAPGDTIRIQTDIAENVARALSAALGASARAAIRIGGTENPEAQKLLLQASEAATHLTKDGFLRAISLLDAAIAIDPQYAEAFAQKAVLLEYYADTYAIDLRELDDYRSRAARAARIAIQLAPNLPTAHRAMAETYFGALKLRETDAAFRRALELAPGDAATNREYSFLLSRLGQNKKALELADKAIALDPLDANAYRWHFVALYYGRKYSEALAFTADLRRRSPQLYDWPAEAGTALLFLNRLDEAQQFFDSAPKDSYRRLVGESVVLIRRRRSSEVPAKIARLRQIGGDTLSYQYGQIYAQLGDKARAFAALDRAWELRDTGLASLRADPYMDPLRDDPRYAALVTKIGFPS